MTRRKGIFDNPARQIIFTKPGPIKSFVRSFRIFWEFFTGFLFIAHFGKAASFFGSSRETLPERYYRDCEELAARLSGKGFAIITGGSGGIMRAANRGAHRANGDSVGINIFLPKREEVSNRFLTHSKKFRYFFSRKTVLSCASEVYVFFPGGYGTLDELFEMLTMVQTEHSEPLPIILYGGQYWQPLTAFIEEKLLETYRTISQADVKLFTIVNSVDEAEHYINSLDIVQTRICKIGPMYRKH